MKLSTRDFEKLFSTIEILASTGQGFVARQVARSIAEIAFARGREAAFEANEPKSFDDMFRLDCSPMPSVEAAINVSQRPARKGK